MFASSIAVATLVLTPPAGAQCREWSEAFHSGFDSAVQVLCTFDDGSGPALYAGGDFTTAAGAPARGIAKWDGAGWSPVGAGTGINSSVSALAVFDDGTGPALYAGGDFTTIGGSAASRIARWDGTSWSALGAPGSGADHFVWALEVFDDGSGPALYAGGHFQTAGGVPASRIAKWDGAGWSPLGSGLDGFVNSLEVFDDGSGPALFVSGEFTTAGGVAAQRLAKWNGAAWSAVGGANALVRSLETFDDGTGSALYVGGSFTTIGGVGANRIARWNGATWSALGSGTNHHVFALAAWDDGQGEALYASGAFTSAGGAAVSHVARWDGAVWSPLGAAGDGTNNWTLCIGAFDDGQGPALFFGGGFTAAGGVPSSRVARWSGGGWSGLGAPGDGLNDTVYALKVFDDGQGEALYAGGNFTDAGGDHVPRIARWDGASWSPLGGPGSGMSHLVLCLELYDDGRGEALYAGGMFGTAGGVPASKVARWDGTSWSALGSGTNTPVYCLSVFDGDRGPELFAGGDFTVAGGVGAGRIARWNGASWSPAGSLGLPTVDIVFALAVYDDGSGPALYAGGTFLVADGQSVRHIAKWNGTGWSPLAGPGSGTSTWVQALTVFDDGRGPALYAGGHFTTADGVPVSGIARWDGTSWSSVGGGVAGGVFGGGVLSLDVFDDGDGPALYAGGSFATAGGVSAPGVAKWNGTIWSPLGSPGTGTNGAVWSFAGFDDGADGDADLYLGGEFTQADGQSSRRIAQWKGCDGEPLAYCFGDGGAAPCPCGNSGLAGHGCDNSSATGGARVVASGTTSPDTLVLAQSGELASSLSIFLQGSVELASPLPFGDGLRCIGGALKRLYVKNASGGTVSAPAGGDPSISLRSAALGDPLSPGDVRHYQVY